jgi:hypothetical protein
MNQSVMTLSALGQYPPAPASHLRNLEASRYLPRLPQGFQPAEIGD